MPSVERIFVGVVMYSVGVSEAAVGAHEGAAVGELDFV